MLKEFFKKFKTIYIGINQLKFYKNMLKDI